MNTSDPAAQGAGGYAQEIDGALAALAAIQPREGLEQRVLARLAPAPWMNNDSRDERAPPAAASR